MRDGSTAKHGSGEVTVRHCENVMASFYLLQILFFFNSKPFL